MLKLIQKMMGDPHKRAIDKIQPIVERINQLEADVEHLSDDDLRNRTYEFKLRIDNATRDIRDKDKNYEKEREMLDQILPEAFATVREASKRVLGQRHYDVQLVGGIVLHRGQISEMKTGEGKTLVSTSPTYLNALGGRGVHVVTVNDYLAGRDAEWMGQIHRFLGLQVGAILHHLTPHERRKVYAGDVIYGTNNEFGFDYLRDNMSTNLSQCVQRELNFAIIDEVDSILIDEARTPLIISGQLAQPAETYRQFCKIVKQLEGKHKEYNKKKKLLDEVDYEEDEQDCDYIIDEKQKNVILTERGILKAQRVLNIDDLFSAEHPEYAHHLLIALKAKELYRRDVEYVVRPNERGELEAVIVDEFTGRLMFGRRYSDGLHQAIEAKENVKIQDETQTLATITLQNYFRLYRKLGGMTGTAITEEAEFGKIYKLPVVVIPTNRPIARQDQPDVIYKNVNGKFNAVADEIEAMHALGRPVLVGTVSIEKSERIGDILKRRGVKHNVLNAKNHEKEAEIIAQAGRYGAVTIATNMAGRGTDILLGGNPEFLMIRKLRQLGEDPDTAAPELKEKILAEMKQQVDEEAIKVREAGGLHVIGTERHESRRIDNQLRGRAGRQGDPGSSRFFLSLEDDLMRMFGGDRVSKVMEMLKVDENEPIESGMVTKAIENAQKKVEMYHFGVRKSILDYDEVMNGQRTIIYDQRRKILEGDSLRPVVEEMITRNMEDMMHRYVTPGVPEEEWDLAGLRQEMVSHIPLLDAIDVQEMRLPIEGLEVFLKEQALNAYDAKEAIMGPETLRDVERMVILRVIDQKWIDHLHEMDALREGIGLRAYGQKDPLIEYKRESRELFQEMMTNIRMEVVTNLFHLQMEYQMPQMPQMVMPQDLPPEILQQLLGELQASGQLDDTLSLEDLEVVIEEVTPEQEESQSQGGKA
ncbi:MAG: preprotein translocase subunit SecA [Candidatus Sericytochromatia bacterium]|nr:preprotein translocase subunit SecA [Candidatus Sericytochromatia bacterium]